MSTKHIAVALTGLFVGLAAVQPSEARVANCVQTTGFSKRIYCRRSQEKQ